MNTVSFKAKNVSKYSVYLTRHRINMRPEMQWLELMSGQKFILDTVSYSNFAAKGHVATCYYAVSPASSIASLFNFLYFADMATERMVSACV